MWSWSALAVALLIALGDSVNLSTVVPALYLATGKRAVATVGGFLFGLLAVNLLAGLVIMLGPGQLLLSLVPKPAPLAKHILELVVGAVLVALAVMAWFRRGTLARHQLPGVDRGGSSVALGAGIGAVELPTAVPYFAGIAVIVDSGSGVGGQVAMLALYNAVFVAPIVAILLTLAVAGDRATRPLHRVNDWLQGNWPAVLGGLGSIVGAVIFALGLAGLLAG